VILMEIGVVRTRSTRVMTRTNAPRVVRHSSMVWGIGRGILRIRVRAEGYGQSGVDYKT
jgi:hypothetical protein